MTSAPCALDAQEVDLRPTFFTAEVTGGRALNIRVQRGSDLETFADGMFVLVRDATDVHRHRLGLPMPIGAEYDSPVQLVFYLNETCDSGFPNDHRTPATILQATGGTMIFDAIYAPEVDPAAALIEARFEGVELVGSDRAEESSGTVEGWFSFFYQRGAPAQRFP
ncbi:MAG: hypothetical protein IT378_21950 [Sandaracinaceae bacterium]|nr:hypothetical protein [Sandaracinaceae bacterium]